MTASAIYQFKEALFNLADSLFADPVLVCWGHPGINLPDDIVGIRDATNEEVWAALGAQRKNEQLEQQVVVSCWSGGTDQKAVTQRAFGYLNTLDGGIRKPTGDPTLGGLVSVASITRVQLTESNPLITDMAAGRVAELVVTISATKRL